MKRMNYILDGKGLRHMWRYDGMAIGLPHMGFLVLRRESHRLHYPMINAGAEVFG
jgi:hypothetical protein